MSDAENVTGEKSGEEAIHQIGAGKTPPDAPRQPGRLHQRFWRWARAGLFILLLAALAGLLPPVQNWMNGVVARIAHPPTPTALPLDAQWATLEARPVQLPTLASGGPCPTTPHHMEFGYHGAGSGPVYGYWDQEDGLPDGELPYFDAAQFNGGQVSGWGGTQVGWVVDARYLDAVLIRGHQLDGDYGIKFNGGLAQDGYGGDVGTEPLLDELRLAGSAFLSSEPQPYSVWLAYIRLQAPGCYAYQVDGLTFHDIIVFQAVISP